MKKTKTRKRQIKKRKAVEEKSADVMALFLNEVFHRLDKIGMENRDTIAGLRSLIALQGEKIETLTFEMNYGLDGLRKYLYGAEALKDKKDGTERR